MITLLDEERQWFKSAQGLMINETPRAISFCGHAVLDDAVMHVTDATNDIRFRDNPLVCGKPLIRMYAGTPLKPPDGQWLGTLCIIDQRPRELTADEMQLLRDLGNLVETEFRFQVLGETERELRAQLDEARRRALIDPLTRLWNREMLDRIMETEIVRSARGRLTLSVMMIDLDLFKIVNDTHGHLAGDEVLREAAARNRQSLREYDSVGRFGGEEFVAVLPDCDQAAANIVAERLLGLLRAAPIEVARTQIKVTASLGICTAVLHETLPGTVLIESADQSLYRAKKAGRDRFEANTLA